MNPTKPATAPYHARFWDFINDSWVKLTLKPGKRITHEQHGQHDEGWWSRQSAWEFDGEMVTSRSVEDGTDCDGRIRRGVTVECSVARLYGRIQELPYAPDMGSGPIGLPDWQKARSGQRDYTAEAAGY